MRLRARARSLALALCLVALTSPAAARAEGRSPYAGKFSGEWTFKSTNALFPNLQRGKMSLTISAGGRVTGSLENLTFSKKAAVKGFVDEDGGLEVTFEFSDQTYTLKGTVNKTKRGALKGTVSQYFGKDKPVGTIELSLPPR